MLPTRTYRLHSSLRDAASVILCGFRDTAASNTLSHNFVCRLYRDHATSPFVYRWPDDGLGPAEDDLDSSHLP